MMPGLRRGDVPCVDTGADEFRAAGAEVVVISKLLGHSSIAVMSWYLDHLINERAVADPAAVDLPGLGARPKAEVVDAPPRALRGRRSRGGRERTIPRGAGSRRTMTSGPVSSWQDHQRPCALQRATARRTSATSCSPSGDLQRAARHSSTTAHARGFTAAPWHGRGAPPLACCGAARPVPASFSTRALWGIPPLPPGHGLLLSPAQGRLSAEVCRWDKPTRVSLDGGPSR